MHRVICLWHVTFICWEHMGYSGGLSEHDIRCVTDVLGEKAALTSARCEWKQGERAKVECWSLGFLTPMSKLCGLYSPRSQRPPPLRCTGMQFLTHVCKNTLCSSLTKGAGGSAEWAQTLWCVLNVKSFQHHTKFWNVKKQNTEQLVVLGDICRFHPLLKARGHKQVSRWQLTNGCAATCCLHLNTLQRRLPTANQHFAPV